MNVKETILDILDLSFVMGYNLTADYFRCPSFTPTFLDYPKYTHFLSPKNFTPTKLTYILNFKYLFTKFSFWKIGESEEKSLRFHSDLYQDLRTFVLGRLFVSLPWLLFFVNVVFTYLVLYLSLAHFILVKLF